MPGASILNLAGAEGFEPTSSVLETDSLAVELTPLKAVISGQLTVVSIKNPVRKELTDH
jgi:hypothetical protein